MYSFEAKRVVRAPLGVVWEVISDHALFGQVAPNLSHVQVLDGQGEGMSRRCTNTEGDSWEESCVVWNPGREYTFEVTNHSDRYPLKQMRGTFGCAEVSGGVEITVRFDYLPKFDPPLMGGLMNWLGQRAAQGSVRAIFDGWEKAISERRHRSQAA
jgi:hypothetical protein